MPYLKIQTNQNLPVYVQPSGRYNLRPSRPTNQTPCDFPVIPSLH